MAKDRAKAIRNELKDLGITSRQVSVRARDWGAVYITIKDLSVNYDKVKKIAKKHESLHTDERSGELLAGGNVFIFIDYDREVWEKAVVEKMEEAEKIFKNIDREKTTGQTLAERGKYKLLYYADGYDEAQLVEDTETECIKTIKTIHMRNEYHLASALVYLEIQQ